MANLFSNTFGRVTEFFTARIPWYKLPVPLGLARVFRIREKLRSDNLYDTSPVDAISLPPMGKAGPTERASRTIDGTYDDLDQPRMGSAGTRFGRNVPPVLPGVYTVRLTVGGKTLTQPLVVKMDPRVR